MRSNIHKLREQAAALRAALLAPSIEGLDSNLPALQEAAITLQRLQAELPNVGKGDAGARQELQALARDWDSAGRLIAQGLKFQQGWARLLASASAGYRPDGEPVSLNAAGSLSVRG